MVPIVSVIVPSYNQAQFLAEALESVLNQTFENWECIIVNDGSTDNTEEVALHFCAKDLRFKYLSKENEDVSAARNDGINKSFGKYILPLDGDDRISPNYIEAAVRVLDNDDTVRLVYCRAEYFGAKNGTWELAEYSLKKLVEYNIIFITALFRKDDWIAVGGFDINVNGAEDWEFWIAILKRGGNVVCLPFVGFFYRQKSDSKFTNLTESDRIKHRAYIYKKHADLVIDIFGNPIYLKAKIESLEYENKKLKIFYTNVMRNPFLRIFKKLQQFSKI